MAAGPAQHDMLARERALYASGTRLVAGVDEAGVGAWAGPVVAAAVLLGPGCEIAGALDSKQLSPKRRAQLAERIREQALAVAIGSASVAEIAQHNVLAASLLAMERAVKALPNRPEHLLVDYRRLELGIPLSSITRGDALCHAIACASIIAKTERDALMCQLEQLYPAYGFSRHKGYGTRAHRAAVQALGPCAAHRLGYKPLRALASRQAQLVE